MAEEVIKDSTEQVWYSFTAGGHKISFTRSHVAQVLADIADFFGENAATEVMARLAGVFEASLTSGNAAQTDAAVPPPPGGYEKCPKCGTDKNRLVPAGISKAGRPYPSFWGCGNSACR